MDKPVEEKKLLQCSFCDKDERAIEQLIAGTGVYICNECIDTCNEIIREERIKIALRKRNEGFDPEELMG
jgi:ATP-dependent Clp protease ATP-binding subunit ClpX